MVHFPALTLVQVNSTTCRNLAAQGDCRFYHCLDHYLEGCGADGYPIGYGYRYCYESNSQRNSFNVKVSSYSHFCSIKVQYQFLLPTKSMHVLWLLCSFLVSVSLSIITPYCAFANYMLAKFIVIKVAEHIRHDCVFVTMQLTYG